MIKKDVIEGTEQVRVTFGIPSTTWADRVSLVGEFNEWDTTATPMIRTRADADWQVTVELKVGQRYRFRYLVDGKEWLNDWHADDFFYDYDAVPNGLCDSVVDLTEFGIMSPVYLS
jgi:1,4-alpha-glucan branching enzyme